MREVYEYGRMTMAVFFDELGKYIAWNRPCKKTDNITIARGENDEIVIHTGYYSWSDGTVRDYPQVDK